MSFDYKVIHTNDDSRVVIPTNNEFRDRILFFECDTREIYSNDVVEPDEEED